MGARLDDWPARLSDMFQAARGLTFAYGAHDCALNAADAIEALTGVDVAADWRGRYATPGEGLALAGAKSLAALPRMMGLKPVPVAMAQRGDIALAPIGARIRSRRAPMLLVVDGAVLRGPAGSVAPRGAAVKAWRVD